MHFVPECITPEAHLYWVGNVLRGITGFHRGGTAKGLHNPTRIISGGSRTHFSKLMCYL